jgi:hypothetical protein
MKSYVGGVRVWTVKVFYEILECLPHLVFGRFYLFVEGCHHREL